VHLFHETPLRVGHHEPDPWVGTDQGPHRPRRQLPGSVIGMALPSILQANGHEQRNRFLTTSSHKRTQLGPCRVDSVVRGVAAERRRSGGTGVPHLVLPTGKAGMDGRHWPQPFRSPNRVVEPGIARGRIAPEHAREVTHPGLLNADPVHGGQQGLR
jgi:hypothetical protein